MLPALTYMIVPGTSPRGRPGRSDARPPHLPDAGSRARLPLDDGNRRPPGTDRHRRATEDRKWIEVMAGWRHIADVQLERLHAAEPAADEARRDIDAVALADERRQLRPPKGDAIEDVEPTLQHQLRVAATRLARACHRQPEHGDERLRVAGAPRPKACQVAMQLVVDVRGGQSKIDRPE